ncbi:MAG: xanthine dehydrogenase family protein molybdopterin-binding subunit [Kofleriaceae bacterium]
MNDDRVDARLKVTGRATYAAEHALEQIAYAKIVPATIAKGRVLELDVSAAQAATGVLRVLTPETMPEVEPPKSQLPGGMAEGRVPLQDDRVCYAGQAVALVVADTLEAAYHAATLVRVRYASEPATTDAFEPATFMGIFNMAYRRGDLAAGLAAAAITHEAVYTTPIEHHNPMEPPATIARWVGDTLELYDSTQGVVGVRDTLAAALRLEQRQVHVISPFVGGGFGCKGFVWPRVILAAVAARELGRPVKLALDRDEMFVNGYRAASRQQITLGATRDGALSAVRCLVDSQTSTVGDFFEPVGVVAPKLYAAPNVETHHTIARLDLGTPTAMRAPGEAPGSFALECAMDELAYALAVDPIELRIKNHADRDPEKNLPWSSKHLLECYRRGAELFGWSRRDPRPGHHHAGATQIGFGMATAIYGANRDRAEATVRLLADGRVEVECAAQDLGTGAYTVMSRIAAETLDVPIENVTSKLGDSSLPPGPLAGGSRTTASIAPVVRAAAQAAMAKLAAGAPRPVEGHATLAPAGTDAADPTRPIVMEAGKPVEPFSWSSFGAHFVEVHVDRELGTARVHRAVTVLDVGRVLSPKTARNQVYGGVLWGIGMALMERSLVDPASSRFVTRDLAEYLIPTHADMPELEVELLDYPDLHHNTLGARGIGEIGIVGVAAAVANAVYHATGKRVRELPITPESLL